MSDDFLAGVPVPKPLRPKRKLNERQLANLRKWAAKPGEVRNPLGRSGKTAKQAFREALEKAATPQALRRFARACLNDERLRALMLERWGPPKVDRLELGPIGESDAHEVEALREKLERWIERKDGAA